MNTQKKSEKVFQYLRFAKEAENSGDYASAIDFYKKHLCLHPSDLYAHQRFVYANFHSGRIKSALRSIKLMVKLERDNLDIIKWAINICLENQLCQEALELLTFYESISAVNDYTHDLVALLKVHVLKHQGLFLCAIEEILSLKTQSSLSLTLKKVLAECYYLIADYKAAIILLYELMTVYPNDPEISYRLSVLLLLTGDYVNGWQYYESRLKLPSDNSHRIVIDSCMKPWNGENVQILSLTVCCEQGIGDTLQFGFLVDYLHHNILPNTLINFYVQPGICQFMQLLLPDIVVTDSLAHCYGSYSVSLLSLARICGLVPENLNVLAQKYKNRASGIFRGIRQKNRETSSKKLVIGLCWRGNPLHKNDSCRSIRWNKMKKLLQYSDEVEFCNLQLDACEQSVVQNEIEFLNSHLASKEVVDSLPHIIKCDLIITVDTFIAHLAGLLGIKTWILLPLRCDWRWQAEGESCFWYENVTLYRQTIPNDWVAVIDSVAADIVTLLK